MSAILLPCPFCGGKPRLEVIFSRGLAVVCYGCGTEGPWSLNCATGERECIDKWNRRMALPGLEQP